MSSYCQKCGTLSSRSDHTCLLGHPVIGSTAPITNHCIGCDKFKEQLKIAVGALEYYANSWRETEYKGKYDEGQRAYETLEKIRSGDK